MPEVNVNPEIKIYISQVDAKEGGPIQVFLKFPPEEGKRYGRTEKIPQTKWNITAIENAEQKFIQRLHELHEEIEKDLLASLKLDGEELNEEEVYDLQEEIYNKLPKELKNKKRDVIYH